MPKVDVAKVFADVLQERIKDLDKDTLDYLKGVVQDEDTEEADLIESVSAFLQSALSLDDDKCKEVSTKIVKGVKSSAENGNPKVQTKILDAPISMAKIVEQQETQVQERLKKELKADVNYNTVLKGSESSTGTELNDIDALRSQFKMAKRQVRLDRKAAARERQSALERDEILKRLENKPVKIHSKGDEKSSGMRDIRLENVTMSLGSLELLKEFSITFADGRKYGLVGRNGIGKTTLLKHLAGHAFPGIPKHLQILHITQEVAGTEMSVLDTVLATDIERDELLQESKILQLFMEEEDKKEQQSKSKKSQSGNVLKQPKTEQQEPAADGTTPVEVEKTPEQKQREEYEALVEEFGFKEMKPMELSTHLSEIFNRLQEIDADSAPARASTVLAGLGFSKEMQNQATKHFSGGWRMRVALAQALFIAPDVLLLDEPTNHLDLHSVLWLEEYLQQWKHTLIIVSHDRDFLNAVPTDIVRMHDFKLTKYKGNYDAFEKQYAESLRQLSKAKEAQDKEIAHITKFIEKNRVHAATAKMAQSRIKKLEKMEVIQEATNDPSVKLVIPEPDLITHSLVQLIEVSFGYSPDKLLYSGINCSIEPDSKIALVGANGVGKSTLLRLILGELQPVSGQIRINPKIRIAKFSQHHMDQLDYNKTPLAWFQEMYKEAKHQDIRKHLGMMGVTGNLAVQPIYSLSGGQKSRVALAHVTWKKPHLLLLDEPTNHLDMETIEALIRALNEYTGAVLLVSHDEHLISTVCDKLWVCDSKRVNLFGGDFDDYKALVLKSIKIRT